MRNFIVRGGLYAGTHIIYDTVEECISAGFTPKIWYECDIGDWSITDDGYCLQLLSKRYVKNKHGQITWLYRYCNGTGVVYIDRKGQSRPYNFYGAIAKAKKNTMSNGDVYLTPRVKLWFTLVKGGADPNSAYETVYKVKPTLAKMNALMSNNKVQRMITKEMVPIIGTINDKLVSKTGKSLDEWFANELVDIITLNKLSAKERLANIKFLKDIFANALGFQNQSKKENAEDIIYEEIKPSLGISNVERVNNEYNRNNNRNNNTSTLFSIYSTNNISNIKTMVAQQVLRNTTKKC